MSLPQGPLDIPFGVPPLPPAGVTRLGVDNAGNPVASKGGAPYAIVGIVAEPAQGSSLTDANATVNPASNAASCYTLPSGTLSAARTLTIGITGSPATNLVVQIIRRDLSANTYTVKDDAGTTLITLGASPATPQGASFSFNGTHFVLLSFYYVA